MAPGLPSARAQLVQRSLLPRTQLSQTRRSFVPIRSSFARQQQGTRCQAPPSGVGGAAAAFPSEGEGDGFCTPAGPPSELKRLVSQPIAPIESSGSAAEDTNEAEAGSSSSSAGSSRGSGVAGGPLAAVKEACLAYDRAVKAKPVLTKALTSFVGFALGDRIAQSVGGGTYDPYRCARLSLYGLLLDGPMGHIWYKLLDRHVHPEAPTSNTAVLVKTALDQLVWGPLMTLVFFAFLKTLEGHPELVVSTIQQRFWPTMLANYVLWPLAHLINFKFVPTDYRILFNNVVALGWTTYLSFTCGPPSGVSDISTAITATTSSSSGVSSVSGVSGAAESAAAAATTALLSGIPCHHKPPSVLAAPGFGDLLRQLAAMERIIGGWGTQSLPSSELLVLYFQIKAEVVQHACQQPIRLPPA